MSSSAKQYDLSDLNFAIKNKGGTPGIKEVVDSISHENSLNQADTVLFQELGAIAQIIIDTKHEISNVGAESIKDVEIQSATDELDAVIEDTANATDKILNATEEIEKFYEESKLDTTKLLEQITNIYESCSFQDITGQRITKVVSVLKQIEDKIDGLLEVFQNKFTDSKPKEPSTKKDDSLLNGPQLPKDANTQDNIDKFFD
jgi:chemotaxis protein CheZ